MQKIFLHGLLFLLLTLFFHTCFAAKLYVINQANLDPKLWLSVIVYGKPTGYSNVAAVGASGDVTKIVADLADDQLGKYRISEIKYCIGTKSICQQETNYKNCILRDSTRLPVNEINAKVIVRLASDQACFSAVMP